MSTNYTMNFSYTRQQYSHSVIQIWPKLSGLSLGQLNQFWGLPREFLKPLDGLYFFILKSIDKSLQIKVGMNPHHTGWVNTLKMSKLLLWKFSFLEDHLITFRKLFIEFMVDLTHPQFLLTYRDKTDIFLPFKFAAQICTYFTLPF